MTEKTNIGSLSVSFNVDNVEAIAAIKEVTEAVDRLRVALDKLDERGAISIRVGEGVKLYRDYAKGDDGQVRESGIAAVQER